METESRQELSQEELPFSPGVGCLLAVFIGLAGAFLAFQMARLVYFGEVRFGGLQLAPNRVWLVREAENAGVVISTTKAVSGSMAQDEICLETKVRALLWRRDDSTPIAGYCLCYQQEAGSWSQQGACAQVEAP